MDVSRMEDENLRSRKRSLAATKSDPDMKAATSRGRTARAFYLKTKWTLIGCNDGTVKLDDSLKLCTFVFSSVRSYYSKKEPTVLNSYIRFVTCGTDEPTLTAKATTKKHLAVSFSKLKITVTASEKKFHCHAANNIKCASMLTRPHFVQSTQAVVNTRYRRSRSTGAERWVDHHDPNEVLQSSDLLKYIPNL